MGLKRVFGNAAGPHSVRMARLLIMVSTLRMLSTLHHHYEYGEDILRDVMISRCRFEPDTVFLHQHLADIGSFLQFELIFQVFQLPDLNPDLVLILYFVQIADNLLFVSRSGCGNIH